MPTGVYIRTEYHNKINSESHKNPSEEIRKKISKSLIGNTRLLGYQHSEKTKQKISTSKKGVPHSSGEESSCWKGGTKLWKARSCNKRRGLGSNFLNGPFLNSEGHHINQNDIIYIPKEWHHIVAHDVWKGKNMDVVNSYAYFFLLMQNSSSYSV